MPSTKTWLVQCLRFSNQLVVRRVISCDGHHRLDGGQGLFPSSHNNHVNIERMEIFSTVMKVIKRNTLINYVPKIYAVTVAVQMTREGTEANKG